MQVTRRSFSIVLSALFFCALLPGYAGASPAALNAFDEAWAKINDYTVTLHAHEVSGSNTQDRVYNYFFKKPHQAKTDIIDGDGKGGGGVWNGGDQVSGHQGGFLSHFHLKVGLHDHRAVSIRGYTIPDGLFQNIVGHYRTIKGDLTEKAGPTVDGQATDEVDLKVASPASEGGTTRMVLYLSKATHMPLRQIRYEGDKVVTDETWTNFKANVGLKDSDFPF